MWLCRCAYATCLMATCTTKTSETPCSATRPEYEHGVSPWSLPIYHGYYQQVASTTHPRWTLPLNEATAAFQCCCIGQNCPFPHVLDHTICKQQHPRPVESHPGSPSTWAHGAMYIPTSHRTAFPRTTTLARRAPSSPPTLSTEWRFSEQTTGDDVTLAETLVSMSLAKTRSEK